MKSNLSAFAACSLAGLLAWTACTSEYEHTLDKTTDGGLDDPTRREVLLTLRNKLSLSPATTKAGEIATAEENAIETLDVYVFGSEEENGTYTFQERFAYRPDGWPIPAGATPLELTAVPGQDNNTTAKLTPKKGLFVRLYCIANQQELKNPAKLRDTNNPADPTTPLTFADPNLTVADSVFSSLVMTAASDNSTSVIVSRPGRPTEQEFLTYRTPFIDPASAADTLANPLPMTGALTVPVDLTDLAVSSRITTGIRLTRMVARFDIVNKAEQSNFRITSVSMENGRKAATFFPIKPYGAQPATDGDLIIYPARKFEGKNANKGNCTGAFYSWPSPTKDQGHLLLKGIYRVNKTDSTEVTYTIPFKTNNGENSTYLDIAHNHRYIVSIIDADPYQLKCTLTTADWEDDGQIDDYEPDNTPGEMKISIPDAFPSNKYIADSSLVYITRGSGSFFNVSVNTNSEITVTKSYEDGSTDKDWLKIEDPVITDNITKALSSKTYMFKVTINSTYNGEEAPRASVTFTDKAQGVSTSIYVKRLPSDIVADNITFAVKAKQDTTFQIITPGGCSAQVTSWNEGEPWFDIVTTDLAASDSKQGIRIKQKDNLEGLIMKPAILTFTNKKPANGDKTILVTPTGFTAPVVDSEKTVYFAAVNSKGQPGTITIIDLPTGGIGSPSVVDTTMATASYTNKTITITGKKTGTVEIKIPNASDTTKYAIIQTTIEEKKYNTTEAVSFYEGCFIAPIDIQTGVTSSSVDQTTCPEGWHIPTQDEYAAISVSQKEIMKDGVFSTNTIYWCKGSLSVQYTYQALAINPDGVWSVTRVPYQSSGNIRCIAK